MVKKNSAIIGAAFLMATSAIGPGFLTQTSLFTEQLLTSFGFVILISVLLDIGAQLNIWRIITVSGYRAQDLANKVFPGLGFFLAALIANPFVKQPLMNQNFSFQYKSLSEIYKHSFCN